MVLIKNELNFIQQKILNNRLINLQIEFNNYNILMEI